MTPDEQFAALLLAYRQDPISMVRVEFGVEPDAWQRRVLEAAKKQGRVRLAMQACVGPGKSAVLAWLGWWALLCFSDGVHHPNGAALSVDATNLKNNLWKELAHWRDQSELLTRTFEMTAESIFARQHPKTWFLAARTWSKSANQDEQAAALAGLHSKAIFYLIDEAGDINPAVLRKAEQGLSNCEWGMIALAGNPTSQDGMLYTVVMTQGHLWHVTPITGDPDDPERSPRIDVEWAKEQIALYGREDPWVMYAILGKFPPSSFNAWLGLDDIDQAMKRHLREDQYNYAQKRLGIDCARFGDDSTVIFPRQGLAAFQPNELRHARGEEVASRILKCKSVWGSELELIDDTGGYGSSPIDAANMMGLALVPIHASSRPDDARFYNARAENTFRACQWIKGGGALPNIPRLRREAVAASVYTFKDGKFIVLEKAQIKANLHGQSPDYWDAFCLTFALAEMPASGAVMAGSVGGRNKVKSEWDPWDESRE